MLLPCLVNIFQAFVWMTHFLIYTGVLFITLILVYTLYRRRRSTLAVDADSSSETANLVESNRMSKSSSIRQQPGPTYGGL